jgi:LysM repeat protein
LAFLNQKDMRMRRKTTGFLFNILLGVLMFLLPACNLSSSSKKEVAVSQTALSVLYTQIASTLAFTATLENLPTPTATLTATPEITPTLPSPTPGSRPSSYILQSGEYPYCIARRFNVDPKELLTLNALSSGMIYATGLTLTIPQSGHLFPAPRALRPHPTTYTVPGQMTVYKVACLFGDVDPLLIIQNNGLTSPILSLGMTLQIP